MWARVIELMLAFWLAISPFVFDYPGHITFYWTTDFVCSALIALFSLLSFHLPLRKMHLCSLLVAFYLVSLGFILKDSPLQPALQNYLVLGITFLMLNIVPTDASDQPQPWKDFYRKKSD